MNKTRRALALQKQGVSAHRWMSHETLLQLEQGNLDMEEDNPINAHRKEVMDYVLRHPTLLEQLHCRGNCYEHPEGKVLLCYLKMKGKLK